MSFRSKIHIEIFKYFHDSAKFPLHDIKIKPSIVEEIKNYLEKKGIEVDSYLNINDKNIQGRISAEILMDYEPKNIEFVTFEGEYNNKKLTIKIQPHKERPSLPSGFVGDYYLQKGWKIFINISGEEMNELDKIYNIGKEISEILFQKSYTSREKANLEKINEIKKLLSR